MLKSIIRITNTKLQLITLVLFLCSTSIYAQLHHQTIGASGGSQTTSNYYVSHSVGQSSVVGASQLNSTLINQGFQQPIFNEYIVQPSSNIYEVKFYPNPFSTHLTFDFSLDYDNIQTTIIDINGRIVFKNTVSSVNQSIGLNLPFLSDSEYIITLTALNFYYQTKIIKKR
jgi:hypothetical protein